MTWDEVMAGGLLMAGGMKEVVVLVRSGCSVQGIEPYGTEDAFVDGAGAGGCHGVGGVGDEFDAFPECAH